MADRWHAALGETIAFLRKNPLLGRVRADLEFPGIRSWQVEEFGRWIVFYGVRDDTLILCRMVSGAMNLLALRFD